jgi:hypothetical protein
MVRLRNAVMACVLASGMTGCSVFHGDGNWVGRWSLFHCDTCDDFPAPAYGPGYSMMPGTYTTVGGGPAPNDPGSAPTATPPAGGLPHIMDPTRGTPPANILTPPSPPVATPAPGADARQASPDVLGGPGISLTGSEPALPAALEPQSAVSVTGPAANGDGH